MLWILDDGVLLKIFTISMLFLSLDRAEEGYK